MSLIAMAVYSTEENKKDDCLRLVLEGLRHTVKWGKHRIGFSVNGFTGYTTTLLNAFKESIEYMGYDGVTIMLNEGNIGTAQAINKVWQLRQPGEHLIKMDDDVVIYQKGWVEKLEQCIEHDPAIGIIGLKRKDCIESPDRTDFYQSELMMLPHKPGEPWLQVEKVNHVMGTACMFNSALVDKIGGLYQMDGLYGFDDSLAAVRCQLAGFYNCFYPHIEIDHIDPGTTDYQKWKEGYAGERMQQYNITVQKLRTGEQSIYYPL